MRFILINKKNIITICSSAMVLILGVSIFLPLYFNYSQKENVDSVKKTNISDFFNTKNISELNNTIFIDIKNDFNKEIILKNITNWSDQTSIFNIVFKKNKIELNIIDLIKKTISLNKQFNNINNYYLQVRYYLPNSRNLLLDVRWTNKSKNGSFFYYKGKINLDIV